MDIFAQPRRFNLTYTNVHNEPEIPICIHRAPLGTHERFIGFLIEHYAGNFPLWLAPQQVSILPISDKFSDYAKKVLNYLNNYDIRCSIDSRNEKIGKKIRDAELQKIPYMLIVGEQEQSKETVSVRRHGEGDKGVVGLKEFVDAIEEEITNQIK